MQYPATDTATVLMRLDAVTKAYGKSPRQFVALRDLSLDIRANVAVPLSFAEQPAHELPNAFAATLLAFFQAFGLGRFAHELVSSPNSTPGLP